MKKDNDIENEEKLLYINVGICLIIFAILRLLTVLLGWIIAPEITFIQYFTK